MDQVDLPFEKPDMMLLYSVFVGQSSSLVKDCRKLVIGYEGRVKLM